MCLFIAWSSDQSRNLAEAFKDLLESAVPELKGDDQVFVSRDIEKGANWFDSIVVHLRNAKAGIVCLTPESLKSPWLHFEAGALAMEMGFARGKEATPDSRSHLFTLLHKVTGAELEGPFSAYQSTATTKSEMSALVRSVATLLGKQPALATDKPVISESAWTAFQKALDNSVVKVRNLVPNLESMFQRKTFTEPLQRCADQAWLQRYQGARTTHEHLLDNLSNVEKVCSTYERGLFKMLLRELLWNNQSY